MLQFEQGANPARVKAANQSAILKTIYHHGPITRAEIARRLGLTLPTITTNVSAMIGRGIVRENGSSQSGVSYLGRKAHPVDIAPESRRFIGMEIQGSRRTLCLVDYRGRTLYAREDGEDCPDYGRNMELARDMVVQALDAWPASGWRTWPAWGCACPDWWTMSGACWRCGQASTGLTGISGGIWRR